MSPVAAAILRVPLVVAVVAALLAVTVPIAMTLYFPGNPTSGLTGINCFRTGVTFQPGEPFPPGFCRPLSALYKMSFFDLFIDALTRSLALLAGAAVLALVVGTLLGVAAALTRRRALASGGIVAGTALLAAVPSFFVAYFLQIAVIVLGPGSGGDRILPVFGFGFDDHLVLPLLSISLPAIAYTAQLTATRLGDVLDSDFITTANAKGLRTSWILSVHALPHARPVIFEALGSGLRVSVASLPIIELLFLWRGIGQIALEAVIVHDAAMLIFSGVALATLFATLSAVADLARPRALYRA
jgi:ABC-type dipeptide/oligopeptide/nickel transport system permease component